MPLSLRALRYVQEALRQGSFTAAAATLNVAPSAIASALDQAETAFGMSLATRARAKGIAPSASGREVLRRIEALLDQYDDLVRGVAELQTGFSGTFSIGYNAPIAPAFLPGIVAPLLQDNPGLSVTLTEGDNSLVQDGLLDGRFDLILFVAETPGPQIETVPLIYAPTYCLCPADHPLAGNPRLTVDQIVGEPIVFLDRPAARAYYRELLESGGKPYRIAATANSTEMARSLVASGIGVALLNMRPRDVPPYAGRDVRCIPVEGVSSGVTISLGFAPGPRRRLVDALVAAVVAYFEHEDALQLVVSPHPAP